MVVTRVTESRQIGYNLQNQSTFGPSFSAIAKHSDLHFPSVGFFPSKSVIVTPISLEIIDLLILPRLNMSLFGPTPFDADDFIFDP